MPAGFSLIELLVVLSIVALLISLFLPALQSAREASWTMTCLSNNRQIGVAFHTYATTHQGLIPGPKSDREAANPNWKTKLADEGSFPPPKTNEHWKLLLACPSQRGTVDVRNPTPANFYGMNMYLLKLPGAYNTGSFHDNWWMPKPLDRVRSPSSAGLVMETKRSAQRGAADVVVPGSFSLSQLADLRRHPNDNSVVLYCDGHSSTRTESDVYDPPQGIETFWEGL